MASPSEPDSDLLAPAAARLTTRFGQRIEAETIHRVLHETYRTLLTTATVTTFLPLLAERSAATRLANSNQALTDAQTPPPPAPPASGPQPDGRTRVDGEADNGATDHTMGPDHR